MNKKSISIANCVRPSRFGDIIVSLPFLKYLEKQSDGIVLTYPFDEFKAKENKNARGDQCLLKTPHLSGILFA